MSGMAPRTDVGNAPVLTADQSAALELARTVFVTPDVTCLIVRGGAGTGKTTLLRAMYAAAEESGARVSLVAPTGRAARVIERRTGLAARTIHSQIYSYVDTVIDNDDVQVLFDVRAAADDAPDVLIVDEASMVGAKRGADSHLLFGSGALLPDLVTYLRRRHVGSREPTVVFVGDPAQLPPVGDSTSPALDPNYLQGLGLIVRSAELHEVVRHAAGSDILEVATGLRRAIETSAFDRLDLPSVGDVAALDAGGVVQRYVAEYTEHGGREIVLVASTNAEVLEWNKAIRRAIHHTDAPIVVGDRLIVVENDARTGYLNGDFVVVDELGATETVSLREVRVGLRAAVVHPEDPMPGMADSQQVLIVESVLTGAERGLTDDQRQALVADFRRRNPSLKPDTAEFKRVLKGDARFNALRVKHGYAVTCHKAQGGEWRHAMVAFPEASRLRNANGFRWVYTAITRGKTSVEHINAPVFQPSDRIRTIGAATEAREVQSIVEARLAARGLEHDLIRPMKYALRMRVRASEATGEIDVHFNGKRKITNVTALAGDSAVTDRARSALLEQETAELPAAVAAAVAAVRTTCGAAGIAIHVRTHDFHVRIVNGLSNRLVCSLYYGRSGAVSGVELGPGLPEEFGRSIDAAVRSAVDLV